MKDYKNVKANYNKNKRPGIQIRRNSNCNCFCGTVIGRNYSLKNYLLN